MRIVLLFLCSAALFSAEPVRFNRDIRPIMSDTCFRCHGPDAKSRMAGLRLDVRDAALGKTKSGIIPIVPGDPDKSAVVQRVFDTGGKIMPPKYAHKELSAAQKDTIRRWIAEGAVYEGHWAYQPIRRPPGNGIDYFIQQRLKVAGLKQSPEADKRTLLRRVSFDLTGVPPTAAEMDAFLADNSSDAYEKTVDRLMSSPRYAEMQTMRWLDAVRYGDSAGFHGDNLWPAWPYRDWVLKAFRDNMPFDQFTREQIAGDLLPNATVDQRVASAYNRLNRASAEGGLQPKEYLAKYGADRVRTTATVWLGATMGCAECHDHKFDPFTAKDFYSFKAFFADIKETGLVPDRGARAWGSKLLLASDEQKQRLEFLDSTLDSLRRALAKKVKSMEERRWDWEEDLLKRHAGGQLAWQYQKPLSASAANGAKLTIYDRELVDSNFYLRGSLASERSRGDGLIIASGPNPDNEVYTVTFKPGAGTWTSAGIDVYQDESLPGNRMARGADRFVVSEVEVLSGGRKIPLTLATSAEFGELPENAAMAAIDGNPATGWAVSFVEARNPFLALRFAEKLTTTGDSVITLKIRQESDIRRATIGRFRVAMSSAEYSAPEGGESSHKAAAKKTDPEQSTLSIATERGIPSDVFAALNKHEEERNEDQNRVVAEFFAWSVLGDAVAEIKKLELQRNQFEAAIPKVLTTERVRPRETRVLRRGNFLDESGEIVVPAIPAVFGKVGTVGKRATRLDLANWIVSKDNPLTARVFVNRTWRQLFGTGLSKVMEDLGSQGEWPTHPELLDWLAAEFQEKWDMKHIIRTMVLSHTYRQASLATPEMLEKDPDNRLLARQNRFRVDAEIVHDTALSIAGLLKERFGGPSVKPPEPPGYLLAMNFPKRDYSESRGDDLYRRALYTQWQRTFLHPTLATFDAPTREECTVNRVLSNTPLQALVLLNDPIFVEAATAFARRINAEGGASFDKQMEFAFRTALNRKPDTEELKILSSLYKQASAEYKELPMMIVARAILNMHETITRN